MGRGRTFRDDKFLEPYIEKMSRGELSTLIRKLLHDYFSNETQPTIEKDRGQREDNIRIFPVKKVEMNFDMFDD